MSRTTLLQERRMQTFQNVLGHWQARRLSALGGELRLQAGDAWLCCAVACRGRWLGMSERAVRRLAPLRGRCAMTSRRSKSASHWPDAPRRCREMGGGGRWSRLCGPMTGADGLSAEDWRSWRKARQASRPRAACRPTGSEWVLEQYRTRHTGWTFQNVRSALEAAERSFHEDDGLDGLFDRRLDKASARRVPADRIEWVLEQYRTRHTGWMVKHFHDHLCAHHGFAWSYPGPRPPCSAQAWCPRHPGAAPTVAGARAARCLA